MKSCCARDQEGRLGYTKHFKSLGSDLSKILFMSWKALTAYDKVTSEELFLCGRVKLLIFSKFFSTSFNSGIRVPFYELLSSENIGSV